MPWSPFVIPQVSPLFDTPTILTILLGALLAGFTTGFAGFGTGLVSSGLWFHALPAAMVPPLVALASVAGQLVGAVMGRKDFTLRRAGPLLAGGVIGVPFGVAALSIVSPAVLRISVGLFLIAYSLFQFSGWRSLRVGDWGGRTADGIAGLGGGFLGGFAGLSAPLPVMWLQLRGGPAGEQRAAYQPFNLVILALASLGMAAAGQMDSQLLPVAALCLPVTLAGAWLGAKAYSRVSEDIFRRTVLALLFASGLILIAQAIG